LTVGAALLVAPPGAAGLTLSTDGSGRILVTGEAVDPEPSQINVSHEDGPPPFGSWRISQGLANATNAPPCDNVGLCPGSATVQPMTMNLAAQRNEVRALTYQMAAGEPAAVVLDLAMNGGAGDDWLWTTSDGGPKRVFGDDGADMVWLTPPLLHATGEYLTAVPGDYVLYGGAGDDVVQAGFEGAVPQVIPLPPTGVNPGTEATVFGGTGNDVVTGNDGTQVLKGEDGDDKVFGGVGDDFLDGGPGNDLLLPDVGFDRVEAGDGDDTIDGMYWGVNRNYGIGDGYELGSVADSFGCGPGEDTVFADGVDLVRSDCENLGTRGACTREAKLCEGTIVLETTGVASPRITARKAASNKRVRLGKGKFRGKSGQVMDQVASLNSKVDRLAARKGVVKAVAVIECTAKRKRGGEVTKVRKVRLTIVRDPTDPTATQAPVGKLKRARCG
jgi:hypothetical protein